MAGSIKGDMGALSVPILPKRLSPKLSKSTGRLALRDRVMKESKTYSKKFTSQKSADAIGSIQKYLADHGYSIHETLHEVTLHKDVNNNSIKSAEIKFETLARNKSFDMLIKVSLVHSNGMKLRLGCMFDDGFAVESAAFVSGDKKQAELLYQGPEVLLLPNKVQVYSVIISVFEFNFYLIS